MIDDLGMNDVYVCVTTHCGYYDCRWFAKDGRAKRRPQKESDRTFPLSSRFSLFYRGFKNGGKTITPAIDQLAKEGIGEATGKG
jgi:hypothetical protein